MKDPELRRFNETPVCTIRIACDRDYRNANGEREADFFDVVTWRKLAEIVSQYAAKGRMVSVGGRLQLRPWQDNEGKKRYFPEIVAEHVYFCDPKPKDQNAQDGQNGYAADAQERRLLAKPRLRRWRLRSRFRLWSAFRQRRLQRPKSRRQRAGFR